MPEPVITITTSCDFQATEAHVWQGITHAVMTLPKPFCFNLGIPLPVKCEITHYENGMGTTRQCTSDKGVITQEITCYEKHCRLSFKMVAHTLRTIFTFSEMSDDFTMSSAAGTVSLSRTTRLTLPAGPTLFLRRWAMTRSIRQVHHFVYGNIAIDLYV
jgi:hypothetical protein